MELSNIIFFFFYTEQGSKAGMPIALVLGQYYL